LLLYGKIPFVKTILSILIISIYRYIFYSYISGVAGSWGSDLGLWYGHFSYSWSSLLLKKKKKKN